jgi:hypothetical protein
MGFRVTRYGKIDHLVADSRTHSQGTGEVLLAAFLEHRAGGSDRVPPAHVMALYQTFIMSSPVMADVLRRLVTTLEDVPLPHGVRHKIEGILSEARDALGPLPPDFDKLADVFDVDGRRQIGVMVCDRNCVCIHGNDDDPLGVALNLTSAAVLIAEAADSARSLVAQYKPGTYEVRPVYLGDVENPEIIAIL